MEYEKSKKMFLNVWREQKLYRIGLKLYNNILTTAIYGELQYNKKSREQGMQMSCYYPT